MNRIGCYLLVDKARTGNGITRCERGAYALVGGGELSDNERDALRGTDQKGKIGSGEAGGVDGAIDWASPPLSGDIEN